MAVLDRWYIQVRRHVDGGAERSVAQCMSWRSVIVPSNRFKSHDCEYWPDGGNVFVI